MDEDDVEELDLTADKNHDDTSHRSAIMRQLISDLCLINDFERNFTQRHPFSTLEVILEEVTPSPSQQQLEESIRSALKSDHSNDYCDFDSDSSNSKNMYRRQERESSTDQSSASGITTARTVNDSNTSNIDVQNSDRSKEKKRKTTDENDESNISGDKQKIYNKYEDFINDDTRYIHKDSPRSKFLTLNKKYERDQSKQNKQKKYRNHIYKTDSFHCLNAYAVKRESQTNITKEIDYNMCTVEELENRLQYFEKQIQNLQNEFKVQKSSDDESSPKEDNISERIKSSNRGDYKLHPNLKNSSEPTPKSSEPTVIIFDADKVQQVHKPIKSTQSNSPTIIIRKSSEFPKVIYASAAKNVATQVENTDWERICYAKKELSEHGSLRISLPNSIDDDSGESESQRHGDYDSYSTDVNFRSECASEVVSQRTILEQTQETEVLSIPEISSEKSKLGWLCCGNCRKK